MLVMVIAGWPEGSGLDRRGAVGDHAGGLRCGHRRGQPAPGKPGQDMAGC